MSQVTNKHFQCRHVFTDGHRCGSRCLRNEDFCYYHHTRRRPAPPANLYRDVNSSFEMPIPEDRSAIQAGIGIVLQRVAQGQLDPKRAGLILYGLQIALGNFPKLYNQPVNSAPDVTDDPVLGPVAPIAELSTSFTDAVETLIYRRTAQSNAQEAAKATAAN